MMNQAMLRKMQQMKKDIKKTQEKANRITEEKKKKK